ncbi:membrane-spanning 4-domains subfamily A member 12 [Sarcophilus harrisii]|uniref:membrane-spanning 4-domains subfamily A member 12 n=1 Tax=Sarcophilus harrisii TaxID=9305 RepID=UPI00062B924E|nr:membrane-spanning 4-domains subfamily A member 12 [Sarcophilus harrisii]
MTSAAHYSWPDRVHEDPPNPYLPSNSGISKFSYPLLPVNVANQPTVGQYLHVNSPQSQSTTQVNSDTTGSSLLFKVGKPLGAIQIMIGLIHIGLGIILDFLSVDHSISNNHYISLSFVGGYPFWGGISYICSGSLEVLAASNPTSYLVKSTLGMNIVSAFCIVVGIILLLIDMFFNDEIMDQNKWAKVSGQGISAMLVIFTLLELSINSKTSNFILQLLLNNNSPIMTISNEYAANSHTPNVSTEATKCHSG